MISEQLDRMTLLGRVLDDHARLEAALADLSLDQFTRPGVTGKWSVKDMLAHITFWEQRMLRAYELARRGQSPPSVRREGESPDATIDRINEENYQEQRDRPLGEILAEYGRSYGRVLSMLAGLTDDELAEAGPLVTPLGRSLTERIAADTYEHYQEHAESIRAWLARGARG
jgi:uncharacterized protein (TIGR03083 family)